MKVISILLLLFGIGLVVLVAFESRARKTRFADTYAEIIADEFSLELDVTPADAPADYPTGRDRLVGLLNVFSGKRSTTDYALYLACVILAASSMMALVAVGREKKLQHDSGADASGPHGTD